MKLFKQYCKAVYCWHFHFKYLKADVSENMLYFLCSKCDVKLIAIGTQENIVKWFQKVNE